MTNNLSYNNFVKENTSNGKKIYASYFDKLMGFSKNNHKKAFRNEFFDNFKYHIPQFYINNVSYIKGFQSIKSNIEILNKKYDFLKKILLKII